MSETLAILTGEVLNIGLFAEVWRVDCMLDDFLFAHEKLLLKQNVKQNKEHDEHIIVAKLQQEMFKRQESSTFMNKKNDFFVNCYGIKLAMCTVYNAEYQITMK